MHLFLMRLFTGPPGDGWRVVTVLVAPLLATVSAALAVGRQQGHSLDPCSHPPPCLFLEKAICRTELVSPRHGAPGQPRLRARYFDADGSEVTCSSDSLVLCEGDSRNVSCPPTWTIKVWFAAFKRSPPTFCHSAPRGADSPVCRSHSVQWELSHMCDGLASCLINTSAVTRDEVCDGRRFLRMEYSCINGPEPNSPTQTEFFLVGIVGILGLFAIAVVALLVTVHIKKRRDSFPLTSLHVPLTAHENPDY